MTGNTDDVCTTVQTVFDPTDATRGWLWRPLLRLLVRGHPVTTAELAEATGHSEDEVEQALRAGHDTEYDEKGRIIGHGITLRPTPHRFEVDGRSLYTWCALDTLLFPAILGRAAEVESRCHTTGRPIRATVEPGQVTAVTPPTAVVSVVGTCAQDSIRTSFCNEVHFFADQDAAQPWLAQHPAGSVLPVGAAHRLGRGLQNTTTGADDTDRR